MKEFENMDKRMLIFAGICLLFFTFGCLDNLESKIQNCKNLPNTDVVDHPAPNRGHTSSRAECLVNLATNSSEVRICNEINFTDSHWYHTSDYQRECGVKIAISKSNSSLCNLLDNSTLQSDCLVEYQTIQNSSGKDKRV